MWDLWIVILNVYCGTIWEPGTDLFSISTTTADDVLVWHELNSCKQLQEGGHWYWDPRNILEQRFVKILYCMTISVQQCEIFHYCAVLLVSSS